MGRNEADLSKSYKFRKYFLIGKTRETEMIFVTVGTHEQQFNRLVSYIDKWAEIHEEEVIIQTGFSTYIPKYCKWKQLFSYTEMIGNFKNSRIAITHGGPSSFIMPLQIQKIPIVVPRKKEFGEHVNNHQIEFCRIVSERQKNIIVVEDIDQLGSMIEQYDETIQKMNNGIRSNNERFCQEFEHIINMLNLK